MSDRPDGAAATIRRGLKLSPELRRGLPLTLVLAIVATAGRVIIPVVIQQVIDGGLASGVDLGFVVRRISIAVVAVAVTAAATGWMNLRLARVSETALAGLRVRAFRHIHDLSMLHQASEQRGALVSRVTSDVDQISRFMQWGGLMLITNGGQALIAVVVMLVYSIPLGLVVLAAVPLITAVVRWFQVRLDVAYLEVRERVGRMLATLAEVVVGAPVIRAYGAEDRTRRRLAETIEGHRAAGVRAGVLSSSFSGAGEIVSSVVIAAVLVAGTILAVSGSVSTGTVVAFLFLTQLFVQPIQMLGEAVNEAQTAVAGWRRVLDVLDIPPDVADPGEDGEDLPHRPLAIRFEGVRFGYPDTDDRDSGSFALTGIDVEIEAASHVAVVGETGSGKTTFAKLATRLMDPVAGRVLIGGTDARRVRFRSLRDRVVMVPQEGTLFSGSIADNVRMGAPDTDDATIERVMRRLGLGDWMAELPAGLHTPVGERGSALSVGERQLVTLARAAIADPEALILDEATSAVDPATEQRIAGALAELTSGRTVITIAHRLSTAENSDRVLVFDEGRIVQDGAHRDLVEEGGVYGRLHAAWVRGVSRPAST